MNAWGEAQVREWIAQPTWVNEDKGPSAVGEKVGDDARGGQALMDYCVPGGYPTVILGRHLTETSMPAAVPESTVSKLLAVGVRRLVIGHTPHGTCPTVVRQVVGGKLACEGIISTEFETIMADTSFSDMQAKDNRGGAVSTVDIMRDDSVRVQGVLPDRTAIKCAVAAASSPTKMARGPLSVCMLTGLMPGSGT